MSTCYADNRRKVTDGQRRTPSDDARLIRTVRSGDVAAFAQLYERHVNIAYSIARRLARSPAEADDLVADAFHTLLVVLLRQAGPDSAFRTYLLTVLRHKSYELRRNDRKITFTDDITSTAESVLVDTTRQGFPTRTAERALMRAAFARLPPRWRLALWYRDVEVRSPAEIAGLLGIPATAVSALIYRAHNGLRRAYLQEHATTAPAPRCEPTPGLLTAWALHDLHARDTRRVADRLAGCPPCQALTIELADIDRGLHPERHSPAA